MINNNQNMNITSENNNENIRMGDNISKITDVNKSLEMSGLGGKEQK